MINKYITAAILAAAAGGVAEAQVSRPVPRLVVSIAIDQLRTDYMEAFMPSYGTGGFRKLLQGGAVYQNARYTFAPVDRASAVASITTGTSPSDNGITGFKWLDKETLIPVGCVDDDQYGGIFTKRKSSPKNIATTTVGDELKIATDGAALVYSIAADRDAAVIGGVGIEGGVHQIQTNAFHIQAAAPGISSVRLLMPRVKCRSGTVCAIRYFTRHIGFSVRSDGNHFTAS